MHTLFRQTSQRTSSILPLAVWAVLVAWLLAAAALGAERETRVSGRRPAGAFVIPAWAFDRGNVKTFTDQWADAAPMVANGGETPNVVEYDIPFPVAAEYTISVLYAAAGPRPVEMSFDGTPLGQACRTATGSWNTSGAGWEETCKRRIAAGKHTLKFRCDGPFPHIVSFRFDAPGPFPPDWKPLRPKARKLDSPVTFFAERDRPTARIPAAGNRGSDRNVRAAICAKRPGVPQAA